jgi:hypothetical protein
MKDFAKSIVCNVKAEAAKIGNNAFQEKTLQYAYDKAKSKGLSGKALEDEILRIATHAAPYASSAHSDSLRREVQEFLLKVGNSVPDDMINGRVGNKSNYRYKGFLITFSQDGIHVFLQNGYTVAYGPTGSEEKAKDWCDWHDPKTNKPVAEFRNSKVGNASGTKEFNTEADLRRWCIEHQYTYTPTHGGYYRLEDDKPGRNRPDLEAHVKTGNRASYKPGDEVTVRLPGKGARRALVVRDEGNVIKVAFSEDGPEITALPSEVSNSKVGNAFDFETQAVVDRKEAVKTAEEELRKAEAERNKHRGERYWEEAYITAKKDVERTKENLARAQRNKAGNSKVGNRDIHLNASNSGELDLSDDGTGSMYDPVELGRYDFSGKSEAMSVARELEQLKRKAEQKVKDADKFINAIKQWASGLK